MKPTITAITAIVAGLIIAGLTAGSNYEVSFSNNGTQGTASGTADESGNLTITGLEAGTYTEVVVTEGTESSDAYATPVEVVAATVAPTEPAEDPTKTAPAEPLSLKDQIKASFAKLDNGDQAANVIAESGKLIGELTGQTFNLSATGSWIMAAQVAEAVKAVEDATRETLDSIGA
jgi:hypothetical protein